MAEIPGGPPLPALPDLALVPDAATRVRIDFGDGGPPEDFALGVIRHLDGRPWECCTRSILQAALDRLQAAAGVRLFGAFEHEFHMPERGGPPGEGYTLAAFRSERAFAETVTAALRQGGITPDTVMREYGADQFELTVRPTLGVAIADQGVARVHVSEAGRHAWVRNSCDPGNECLFLLIESKDDRTRGPVAGK